MDKLKYVAKRLNMLPYRSEAKKEIVEFAKENGIVIVYGASDDLMELDGAIYDEFGCYEGGVCVLRENYVRQKCGVSKDEGRRRKLRCLCVVCLGEGFYRNDLSQMDIGRLVCII